MENPQNLPPIIQHYLNEQNRKKKKNRNTVIVIVIFFFLIVGYLSNTSHSDNPKGNKHHKAVADTVETQKLPAESLSADSVSPGQTKTNQTVNSQLSEDDQETKGRYGEVSLEIYVKDNMNDPDSYEKISSDYSYYGSYFIVTLKFRGKNEFGGMVINYAKAKTDLDGNIIEIIND
jgi:hypothetical protein